MQAMVLGPTIPDYPEQLTLRILLSLGMSRIAAEAAVALPLQALQVLASDRQLAEQRLGFPERGDIADDEQLQRAFSHAVHLEDALAHHADDGAVTGAECAL